MKYKLPVIITKLEDGQYMANCETVNAVATGDTINEAVTYLQEGIEDMVAEFGEAKVFEKVNPNAEVQVLEIVAV